jgi:hypothetical protein
MQRPNKEFNAGGRAARKSFKAYLKRLAAKKSTASIVTIIAWLDQSKKRNSDEGGFGSK